MRKTVVALALLALIALAWFLLNRSGSGNDPLDFVPADTPYVFANLEPLPADVTTRYLALSDSTIPQWRAQLARGLKALEEEQEALVDPDRKRILAWLRAVDTELAAHADMESLVEALGTGMKAKMAIYGIGAAPVIRLTLADPARLVSLVERLESTAGEKLPRFEHAGVATGWKLELPDAPIIGVFAIIDGHLVTTMIPKGEPEAIDELLGIVRPKRSLARSGDLARLNREAGFLPYGSGYVDTARVLALFRTPATPLERAFLTALDAEKPVIPEECAGDMKAIVASFPRAIAGYTRLDKSGLSALARIETSSAIAEDLKSLLAPTPGLTKARDALASFSFSMRPGAIPALSNRIADNNAKNPWTCPALASFNDVAQKAREVGNSPALYAAGPMAYSLHVAVSRLAFTPEDEDHPVDFAGKLLIGSDNPAGLVAMSKTFVPQLAELNLAPGAPPQRIPDELTGELSTEPVFAAQTATALGFSVGAGEEADLPGFLEVDPNARQPLLQVAYRGELMAAIAAMLRQVAEKMEPGPDRDEMLLAVQTMEQGYADQIRRAGMSVEFSGKGIEFLQEMVLK